MDNTSVQATLVQQQQSQANNQDKKQNQDVSEDKMMNTAPEIDLLSLNTEQAQGNDQQDIEQQQPQLQQQQVNPSEINTINPQVSLVQPNQNQQNDQTSQAAVINLSNDQQKDESIVNKKSQSQHNSEAVSAGSGNSQTNPGAQMQAMYENINSTINPLLSVGVQQHQQLQKKNFLQPDPEFAEDESEYYSSSEYESNEGSDGEVRGHIVDIPKREPFVRKISNAKNVKLAKSAMKHTNKFIFNRFFAQLFSKINQSKYPVSFLASDGAQHSLLHHLTDYKYLSRSVKMHPYFETNFKQRIYPDLCQCMQLQFTIDKQLLWDAKVELQNGIIFQAQICTFCMQNDEVKILKLSNIYQEACSNEQSIAVYAKADLVKDPLSFIMIELCGYQDNILRSYCHGVVKLSNGFEYKNMVKLQSSKINNLLEALDTTETIMDSRNHFSVIKWENRQQVLHELKNNRLHCQNVFRRSEQRKIQLFSGSAVQSGDELSNNISVGVDNLKNKTVERLTRLPENLIIRLRDLRILDHGAAIIVNSGIHFIGPETFDVSESVEKRTARSRSRSLSRSRAKSTNKVPSRSSSRAVSRGRKISPVIPSYEFDSIKSLKEATAHFESLLARARYRVDQKIQPFYDGMGVVSTAFSRVYKQRERIRREQMKSQVTIHGAVDRILLSDFVQLMVIVQKAMMEAQGQKEIMDIIKSAYRWT